MCFLTKTTNPTKYMKLNLKATTNRTRELNLCTYALFNSSLITLIQLLIHTYWDTIILLGGQRNANFVQTWSSVIQILLSVRHYCSLFIGQEDLINSSFKSKYKLKCTFESESLHARLFPSHLLINRSITATFLHN